MPRATAEEIAEMRAKGDFVPVSRTDLGKITEKLDKIEAQQVADSLVGPPPPVVQHVHEAPRVENRVLLDAGSTKKGSLYGPTEAPIASAVHGTPSVMQWAVYRDVDGVRSYLGRLASHARPEALIARYPGAMPAPGQIGLYLLKSVNPEGKESGTELPFHIDGNNPDVISARAALAPSATSSSALDGALATLLERQARAADAALAEAKEEARRVAQALAAERRELADRLAAAERERAERARTEADATVARIQAEARIAADAERERRRQDREDLEARYRQDREERERRDAREREERQERERERERMLAAERERDREHQQRLASLTAASSLESTVAKAGTLLGALGIEPGKIVQKLLGTGDGDTAPVVGEGTAAVIGGVISNLVTQIGNVVTKQMEIQAAMAGNQAPARAPASVHRPQLTGPVPAAPKPPAPAPASVATPKEEPVSPEPKNEALAAIPVADQRRARAALRKLAEILPTVPEASWQAEVIQAVAATPQIIPFVKAVGVKKAAMEAGVSEEDATKIEAAVPPGVL